MAKARVVGVAIIGLLLLMALIPGSAVVASLESPPARPVNLSPDDATTEISPVHTFFTEYSDNNTDDLLSSQWQVIKSDSPPSVKTDGSYDKPLWDSGFVGAQVTYALPVELLEYGQRYWWHVRVQDVTGAWSLWSAQTWFQVIANSPPNQPGNVGPLNNAVGISVTPVLQASGFSDPNTSAYAGVADSQGAARWQIRSSAGTYDSPVWDSGITSATTSIVVPGGKLLAGTTYYWRVQYRDNYDDFDDNEDEHWSAYSEETSFTTKALSVPVASFTADKTDVVAGRDVVTFTDNSTPVAEIDLWVWDFGDGTTDNWTNDTRPPNGEITHTYTAGGTYTVNLTVDNSATDGESMSMEIVVHAKPAASFTASPASPKAGKEITFTDTSTGTDDIVSWEWQFDDGTTATWTAADRPQDGQITHTFKKGGEHTVSLRVQGEGDLGESYYNKKINVREAGGFKFGLWMIAVGVGVVVVIAGVVYLVGARRSAK